MADQKRAYRKKLRAEQEHATRLRITESAVALHGSLGPTQTTMSAIAERAGVRRSTLYRHFPDEDAVFLACSAHWINANPLPDLARWVAIAEPDERLQAALRELYEFYGRTDRMISNLLRDEGAMPTVKALLGGFREYMAAAHDTLMTGTSARGAARKRLSAAIGHALAFTTWRSLVRDQQLDSEHAVDLMCRLAGAATAHGDPRAVTRRRDRSRTRSDREPISGASKSIG
jgi:AcrR family transcriptional regulator